MTVKKLIHFNSNFYLFGLSILIINIILLNLPLTSTFGYEFAAINGLLFVIISGLFSLSKQSHKVNSLTDLTIALVIFLLIPLIAIVIKSLLTMFCSFWDGIIFYLLIVCTSVLFGTALAFLINIVLDRFRRTIFIVTVVLIAFIPIVEIYFLPQVYFYSPLIGFFPGNIYDEGLSPNLKLLVHQIIVAAFSISIIYSIVRYKQIIKSKKYYFIILLFIITTVFQFSSSRFGFTTTFSKLENTLPKKIQSDKFCLHYEKLNFSEAQYVALNIEYFYLELVKLFNLETSKPIQIYLFNDRKQKKIHFGAGNADVAKPWQSAIYISKENWEKTLKHEMVHIFAAEFGSGVFKLASGFNPALIEGLAESVEGTTDEMALVDFTALAFNHHHRLDIASLFSGFNFFKSNSSLSYTYSGAFITHLIEKYGIEKVKQFYANGDFNSIFGSDLKSVQKEFETKIESAYTVGNQAMADYYFGKLSIIQKVCPRYISDRLTVGYENLNKNNLVDAKNQFLEINNKSLNYSALIGLSEIFILEKNIDKAIRTLYDNLNNFNRTPFYYNLLIRIADVYQLNNNPDSAKMYLEKLIIEKPNYELFYLAKTRLNLLDAGTLKEYVYGEDSTKYKLLVKLNEHKIEYNSIPILINLSLRLKIKYKSEINNFNKTFMVNNLESSYAAFKLSQYMLANGDYINGRKYAALSLRYKDTNSFILSMIENYKKANWLFAYASEVLESFNVSKN